MSAPTTHAAPATTTGAAVETTQRQDAGAQVKAPTGTEPSATTSGTPATTGGAATTADKENVSGESEAGAAAATEPEGGYPEQVSAGSAYHAADNIDADMRRDIPRPMRASSATDLLTPATAASPTR